jgi:hypothetical protein
MFSKTRFFVTAFAVILAISSSVSDSRATTLSDHFGSALPGSTGTEAYDDLEGLSGTIDYAVFEKADFDALFSNSTVAVGAGELAYTYQIKNTGADYVSQNRIGGFNTSVTGIGYANADAGEIDPTSVNLVLPPPFGLADWFYDAPDNVFSGETSAVMILTSTNLPSGTTLDIVFNGGGSGPVDVIAPGNVQIPEPTTFALLGIGSVFLLRSRRRSQERIESARAK